MTFNDIDNKPGEFLAVGSGGHFKGKDPNISLADLKSNWVDNTKVVYIGKATSYSNDYGVDVFATKGKEKIAVQAKMYGGGTRKINRQMVMELHGAKDYFDCTKAIIGTDGIMHPMAEF